MKRGAPDHPKTKMLASLLGLKRWEVIGLLEGLWHFAANYAKRGNIGKWSDAQISSALEWERTDPEALVQALISAGYFDVCEEHRLLVHGWEEHADQTVRRSEEIKKLGFASRKLENASQPSPMPSPSPSPMPSPEPGVQGGERDSPSPPNAPDGAHSPTPAGKGADGENLGDTPSMSSARENHGATRAARCNKPPPNGGTGGNATKQRTRQRMPPSPPPADLSPEQHEQLAAWCRKHERPEIRQLASRMRWLVEQCLDYHRAEGKPRADWLAACRKWVSIEAEGKFAPRGSPSDPRDDRARRQREADVARQEREQRERKAYDRKVEQERAAGLKPVRGALREVLRSVGGPAA